MLLQTFNVAKVLQAEKQDEKLHQRWSKNWKNRCYVRSRNAMQSNMQKYHGSWW
jgi:hypothetical protein